MTISTRQEQVTIRIVTDQASVKNSIESNLHILKMELKNHGLTIDKIDVLAQVEVDPQAGKDSSYPSAKEHSSQNGRQQAADRNPDKEDRRGEESGREEQPRRDQRRQRSSKQEGISHFV
jgi:flagellar hook-length control protein FliK